MAPQGFIQVTREIIEERRNGSAADKLLEKYPGLRCFFPEKKHQELAYRFVSFCQGSIGEERFQRELESLGGFRGRRKRRRLVRLETNERYFFKPYSPK